MHWIRGCICGDKGHLVRISSWHEDDEIHLSLAVEALWRAATLRERILAAWSLLLGRDCCTEEVRLSPEDARALAVQLVNFADVAARHSHPADPAAR